MSFKQQDYYLKNLFSFWTEKTDTYVGLKTNRNQWITCDSLWPLRKQKRSSTCVKSFWRINVRQTHLSSIQSLRCECMTNLILPLQLISCTKEIYMCLFSTCSQLHFVYGISLIVKVMPITSSCLLNMCISYVNHLQTLHLGSQL